MFKIFTETVLKINWSLTPYTGTWKLLARGYGLLLGL